MFPKQAEETEEVATDLVNSVTKFRVKKSLKLPKGTEEEGEKRVVRFELSSADATRP